MGLANDMVQAAKNGGGKASIKTDGVTFAHEVAPKTGVAFMAAETADATFNTLRGLELRTGQSVVLPDGSVKRLVGRVKVPTKAKAKSVVRKATKASKPAKPVNVTA